jgi:hypothetical protein
MTMTQHLRLSQFVTTYGPGAILESAHGPRIIPMPDIGLFYEGSGLDPAEFEVSDQRMSDGLLRRARIFRLPSNAELGIEQDRYVYRTRPFPYWKLCLNISGHNADFYVLHHSATCPVCGRQIGGRGHEAIRFIVACPNGHLDEFDWFYFVHAGSPCVQRDWFKWYGGGGALSQITIECHLCNHRSRNLGLAWGQPTGWACSGRFPEREIAGGVRSRNCTSRARLIQRQASNLRIPEILTLFSIPPRYTQLHNLLSIPEIRSNLEGSEPTSLRQLSQILTNLARRGRIPEAVANTILQNRGGWREIQQAIRDVLSDVPHAYSELIREEFNALIDASNRGAPPLRGPVPNSPVIFEVDPSRRLSVGPFRVTPVLRLRTVVVQRGYRREVDTQQPAGIVPVYFPVDAPENDRRWYPGAEFLGEGVFLTLEQNDGWFTHNWDRAAGNWHQAFSNPGSYERAAAVVFRDPEGREELHPMFVWWHTLSHLLIRAIGAEAGYSSASIRERVYFETDSTNANRTRGGVLFYATQPGTEGTLGGLIALVPYFQHLLDVSFEALENCSGDPLCLEHGFRLGQYNGSACYGCLLVSETSCEHRNMWLDRRVLLENRI